MKPQAGELWRVNRYLWLILAFSAVWLAVRAAPLPTQTRLILLAIYLLAVVNVATRTYVGYRSPLGTTGKLGWLFTSVDIALIAFAVRLTGGLSSDLWLLYFFVMVTETLSVSVRAEMTLTLLVYLGLTIAVWPITDPMTLATRMFFLFITGAVARRIYVNAEARNEQLSHLREEVKVEQEKSRLAREIHDGVGREIVNAVLGLEVAARVAEKGGAPEEVPASIRENIDLLRSAMESTRQLVFETKPWTTDDGLATGALAERLAEYARRFADRSRLAVDIVVDPAVDRLPASVAFAVLRVMQEALNNVAKHAKARSVIIRAESGQGHLVLTVKDDGAGFDPGRPADDGGIGLSTLRERAESVGGRVDVDSAVGAGTTVTLVVPV